MPQKMLVVDDEDPILFAMREYFTICGFEVDTAKEAGKARALIEGGQYAVAIVDLRLSGFAGTEGLEIVRFARERQPDMRIVVLTAYGTADVEKEARALGVDSFLQKPKPLPDIAQVVFGLMPDRPQSPAPTEAEVGG